MQIDGAAHDRLYLHHSGTHHGIYEARFTARGDRWRITEAFVETWPERHECAELPEETEQLVRVVDTVLVYRDTH